MSDAPNVELKNQVQLDSLLSGVLISRIASENLAFVHQEGCAPSLRTPTSASRSCNRAGNTARRRCTRSTAPSSCSAMSVLLEEPEVGTFRAMRMSAGWTSYVALGSSAMHVIDSDLQAMPDEDEEPRGGC